MPHPLQPETAKQIPVARIIDCLGHRAQRLRQAGDEQSAKVLEYAVVLVCRLADELPLDPSE